MNLTSISYKIIYGVCYAISLLPLSVLYVLADVLGFLLYYVVRYRRHIVHKNLTESLPDKTSKDIMRIEKKFYLWLCDYVMETLKMMSIGEGEISRRMKFIASEKVKDSIKRGKSCAVYLGHYCNWEWVTSLPLWMDNAANCGQIYHPLENRAFDRFFLRLRSRFGAESMSMKESFRHIVKHLSDGDRIVVGFIADQVPTWNSIHYWTDFLRHDTPVFTGAEKIAHKCDLDVYYLDVRRLHRGYYTAEFKLITDDIGNAPDFSVTEAYLRMLEETINRAPQYWLWSHNRWKRTHKQWESRNT